MKVSVEKDNDLLYRLLFFIIWPFGAFLYSILQIRSKSSLLIVYLWFIVFGIGFSAKNPVADSFRYVEDFKSMTSFSRDDYAENVAEYFTFESNIKDLYTYTVNVVVSQFTDNYHYIFLIFAIVFGSFYVKSLGYFTKLPKINNKCIFYCLLFVFCFSNPIFNINGVRFWTASWIGTWFLFKIFVDNNYKYLPFITFLPLVHGSFIIYVVLVLLACLLIRKTKFLIPLFIISFFVSAASNLELLHSVKEYLPKFLQNQIWSYSESSEALQKMQGVGDYALPLYARFLNFLPILFWTFLIFILLKEFKKLQINTLNVRIVNLILFWYSFVNFTMSIPSVGARFQQLGIPLIAFIWLFNYKVLKKYNFFILCAPIFYSYAVFYWCKHMISISDMSTYFTPLPFIINQNLL